MPRENEPKDHDEKEDTDEEDSRPITSIKEPVSPKAALIKRRSSSRLDV